MYSSDICTYYYILQDEIPELANYLDYFFLANISILTTLYYMYDLDLKNFLDLITILVSRALLDH